MNKKNTMQAENSSYEEVLARIAQAYPKDGVARQAEMSKDSAELSGLLALHAQAEADETNARNQKLLIKKRILVLIDGNVALRNICPAEGFFNENTGPTACVRADPNANAQPEPQDEPF